MSYLSVIANVCGGDDENYHNVEIVAKRVKVSAFVETEGPDIIFHITDPTAIGPTMASGTEVRVVVFEHEFGGAPLAVICRMSEVLKGKFIRFGRPK